MPETAGPERLLGSLEMEVMTHMWRLNRASVRQVVGFISRRRPVAYTTVMTVMGHLVEKGLLAREPDGRKYRYLVTQTREQFLRSSSQEAVRSVLSNFGDLAVAGFLGEIGRASPERLAELRRMLDEATDEGRPSQ